MNVERRSSRPLSLLTPHLSYLTALAVCALLIILSVLRLPTEIDGRAAVAVGCVVAVLTRYPLYLNPIDELPLISVVTIPALMLYGWPTAIAGAALGLIAALIMSRGAILDQAVEEVCALGTASVVASIVHLSGPAAHVEETLAAALAYALTRTLVAATLLDSQEGIDLLRALGYLVMNTRFHSLVLAAAAAGTVWLAHFYASATDRLLLPVLTAGLTLQLYLPRILRGEEQRRVLAAVAVLAAAIDAKDPYTGDHSMDVAILSRRMARALGLDELQAHQVYLSGLLHDVGKTVVPPSILLKPGKLTGEEWAVMQSHVDAGVRIIKSIEGLSEIAPIVAASHERLDGRGYPKGLAGDAIPLASRINFVVDAYNALTTDRPDRKSVV